MKTSTLLIIGLLGVAVYFIYRTYQSAKATQNSVTTAAATLAGSGAAGILSTAGSLIDPLTSLANSITGLFNNATSSPQ